MKVLFIGDLHFKTTNNDVIDIFIDECINTLKNIKEKHDDVICVIGGDILDTHERLHQVPYSKAIYFIESLSKITKVIILVGNHDYCNNQQFLSKNHWMIALDKWPNVWIADRVLSYIDDIDPNANINKYNNFYFLPYVPPGRFLEALDTYMKRDWREATCIFAHQEFFGCSLGFHTSEHGDKWHKHYPLVISGHIHKRHKPQDNILYPGSVLQHNFGEENNDTGILLVDFEKQSFDYITINVPKRITITTTCEEFENTINSIEIKPLQKIRVVCEGSDDQFKRIKKTSLYNHLPIGVYVTFKTKNNIEINNCDFENLDTSVGYETFENIFSNEVKKDTDLMFILDSINQNMGFKEMLKQYENKMSSESDSDFD